jgi:AraC-like DNA-binding protein
MISGQYSKQYLYRQIVLAKLFIDTHFTDDIDLEAVCDKACFSKFHFIRLFKNTFHKTPHQYLTAVRLAKARELLANGDAVRDVCFNIGFDSVSSFKLLFRKSTGFTPSAWQKQAAKRKAAMKITPEIFAVSCLIGGRVKRNKAIFDTVEGIKS